MTLRTDRNTISQGWVTLSIGSIAVARCLHNYIVVAAHCSRCYLIWMIYLIVDWSVRGETRRNFYLKFHLYIHHDWVSVSACTLLWWQSVTSFMHIRCDPVVFGCPESIKKRRFQHYIQEFNLVLLCLLTWTMLCWWATSPILGSKLLGWTDGNGMPIRWVTCQVGSLSLEAWLPSSVSFDCVYRLGDRRHHSHLCLQSLLWSWAARQLVHVWHGAVHQASNPFYCLQYAFHMNRFFFRYEKVTVEEITVPAASFWKKK